MKKGCFVKRSFIEGNGLVNEKIWFNLLNLQQGLIRNSVEKLNCCHHCAKADVSQAQAVTAGGRRCSGTKGRWQPRFLWKPAIHVRINCYKIKYQHLPLQNQFRVTRGEMLKQIQMCRRAEPQSQSTQEMPKAASPRLHVQHNSLSRHNLQMQTVLESVSIWQMKRQKTSVSS